MVFKGRYSSLLIGAGRNLISTVFSIKFNNDRIAKLILSFLLYLSKRRGQWAAKGKKQKNIRGRLYPA